MSTGSIPAKEVTKGSSAPVMQLLMCAPDYFEVTYEINQWMEPRTWSDNSSQFKSIASQQWQNLYQTFQSLGVAVNLIKQEPGLPDMVFTANAAIVLDGKALLERFRYKERQPEEKYFAQFFSQAKTQGLVKSVAEFPPGFFQEGAGDCIWDNHHQLFWTGYGPRSSKESTAYIQEYYGKEVIALELLSSRFYHLDLSLSALKYGDVIYYPDAFSKPAQKLIQERVSADKLIALTKEDAYDFVCNLVNIDDKIILSRCSDKLQGILQERGYSIMTVPVDKFGLAGGSVCCLTLRLDLQSKV